MTRLLARETPKRSTLNPNRIAPNPPPNPNVRAKSTADRGQDAQSAPKSLTVAETTASGITIHDVTMNTSQMCSHFQRGMIFIGAVKRPLQTPEAKAKKR